MDICYTRSIRQDEMAKIDDNMSITINIRYLLQGIVLIGMIGASYWDAKNTMAENHRHIEILEKDLIDLKGRISAIETKHIEELEETNKSLMEKVNIFKKR